MRGSAYVKLRIYQINRDGSIDKSSIDTEYGHSKVGEMNNTYERETAYFNAIWNALKIYRNSDNHKIGSDTEINYHLLDSGILRVGIDSKGKGFRKRYNNRISPQRKREIHKIVPLGLDKPMKLSDVERDIFDKEQLKEMTIKEYKGKPKLRKEKLSTLQHTTSNIYIVDTGFNKKKVKVKRKNVRNYLGMNRPASKELRLSKKSQPKSDEIFIDKSLKGRKKRQVIAHEVFEQEKMKRGMKYRQAHKKATKFEKRIK